MSRTYWFIKLVLPTPLSPRMMTCRKSRQIYRPINIHGKHSLYIFRTLRRTFFLDDMLDVVDASGHDILSVGSEFVNKQPHFTGQQAAV